MNAATFRILKNCVPSAPQSAASALVAVRTYLIAVAMAMVIGGQAFAQTPTGAASVSPLAKATHLWHGTVHAQSSYASQELDGSPGTHAWTRKYRVVLLEIHTTSSRGVFVDGNWVSWPLNDLVPVLLEYQVEAFTDDRPYSIGPAHGGHVATGTASGTMSQSQLVKVSSDQYDRVGGTWGDMQRIVAPETHPSLPSTWTRPGDYHASQNKAMESPGGYDIGFGLMGVDSTDEEKKALYDGISLTYVPEFSSAHHESLNASDKAHLETPGGFISCMGILEPVHIFGFLERPDQNEVHGSHFYNQHDPTPDYSPPQILVTWDFKRIPYQPFIQIEYQQKQDRNFVGPLMWLSHNDFVDFLVGHKQAPIDVRIRTIPEDAAVQWTLAPDGNHSGRINPNRGTSKDFSFTPNVENVRPIIGSPEPNLPIAYTLTIRNESGSQQLARETIQQDPISILRQEYVDSRRPPTILYGLVPPPREQCGTIEPFGGNFTFNQGRIVLFGNYFRLDTTLNGGWRDLALNTQGAYGGIINLTSAFRNPQRNTWIPGPGSPTSIHMMGRAVDMDMQPQTINQMVRLHRAALAASGATEILLERAGRVPGGNILVPKNWGPPPAQHTFAAGRVSVVVEDSDGDDLPDRVIELIAEPRGGIPSATNLPYAGGGTANPSFRIRDINGDGRINLLEPLVLVHSLGGVAANSLSRYYDFRNGSGASHVHCAIGEKAQRKQGNSVKVETLMDHYFASGTRSSAAIAILVGLLSIGGCKRQPVSVATRDGQDANSTIPQVTPAAQDANPLAGLAATINVSETNVVDPTAADKKIAGNSLEELQAQGAVGEGVDPDVLAELGRLYETGTGTNVDYKLAAEWYHRAAEKQNVNAIVRLGLMYQHGRGVRIDARQSAMWFRVAADKNNPLAMARLGKLYLEGIGIDRDLESAADWLRKAAEQGEPDAMLEIAGLLESGMIGEQDIEEASRLRSKAKECMESAAAAENLRAIRWLAEWAITNESGGSGQPSFDDAHRWLLRASELGDTLAMVRLAELLAADSADPAKQAEAIAWCTKAADTLEPSALLLLADFHDRGFGVPQDVRRAFELRKQSAECGDIRGMRLCAEMLMQGWGTKAQLDVGMRWYQLAAGLGDGPSMAQVGISFKEGRGYEKNDAMAVAYFTRGAAQNDPESLFQMAACREMGSGVPQDLIAAAQGFLRSAGLGHREAMFRLAELLSRKDNGLKAGAADAVSWYELAALKGHSGAAERLAQMYATGDRVEQSEQLAAAWKARVEAPIVPVDGVARPPANRENATPWGTLTAPNGDGATTVEGNTLWLKLNVELGRLKSDTSGAPSESSTDIASRHVPRILNDVTGDFTAEVTLPGPIRWEGPETDAGEKTPPPGVAGMLIWQNEENFARLDRVGTLQGDQIQHTCDLQIVKDGAQIFHASKALSTAAVRLRLERNGNRLRASVTQDAGQTWMTFRSQPFALNAAIEIGIAALNNSTKPIVAEFQDFMLDKKE